MLDILIISSTYATQVKYYCIMYKQIEASWQPNCKTCKS